MKVKINTKDTKINICIPTFLVLNNFSFSILMYVLSNQSIEKKYIKCLEDQKEKILKLMKMCRKQYKGLTIVDIKTSEGEKILITL